MKVYVLSDSHNSTLFARFLDIAQDADAVIHLGDGMRDVNDLKSVLSCPVYSVSGNCDPPSKYEDVVELGGVKIFFTHGHMYHVNASTARLEARARELGAAIALYGHTHVPEISFHPDVTVINPGSLTRPRAYLPTYAVLNIENNKVHPELVEYKGVM
jgi:putative phosphoesterase